MADKKESKAVKIENGYAELKPSEPGKKAKQFCFESKTFKGGYTKIVEKLSIGKVKTEVVQSKTRFVPKVYFELLPENEHEHFIQK